MALLLELGRSLSAEDMRILLPRRTAAWIQRNAVLVGASLRDEEEESDE